MPELPEVQTTVNGINAEARGLSITDVWTSYKSHFHIGKNNIKDPRYFAEFKKEVIGAKITHAERQGKNVLIHLSNPKASRGQDKKTILVHMKMTGHFMYGKYQKKAKGKMQSAKQEEWEPKTTTGPLRDPFNRHIRLLFSLSNGNHLAFSDSRKFAKVFIFDTTNRHTIEDLMHLGPDPLTNEFTYRIMKERLELQPKGKIKQILMDQTIISGIGNIYSDEMLWKSGIHPLSITSKIPEDVLKKLFNAMREVLDKGINFGGDSDSDYRNIYGEAGKYQHKHNAYRRTGESCPKKDGGVIERIKVGGRSGHFCSIHQKLFT